MWKTREKAGGTLLLQHLTIFLNMFNQFIIIIHIENEYCNNVNEMLCSPTNRNI